jgi:hypothetical protein
MDRPRFVFVSTVRTDRPSGGVVWLLMSANNRRLGRSRMAFASYDECREAVLRLQREHARVRPQAVTDDATGRFGWRVDLDAEAVAISSRSYLRARECDYNLTRFLESVPNADVVDGAREPRIARIR